jgi:hypothetical protein
MYLPLQGWGKKNSAVLLLIRQNYRKTRTIAVCSGGKEQSSCILVHFLYVTVFGVLARNNWLIQLFLLWSIGWNKMRLLQFSAKIFKKGSLNLPSPLVRWHIVNDTSTVLRMTLPYHRFEGGENVFIFKQSAKIYITANYNNLWIRHNMEWAICTHTGPSRGVWKITAPKAWKFLQPECRRWKFQDKALLFPKFSKFFISFWLPLVPWASPIR